MMLPDSCVGIMEYRFIKYEENKYLEPGDYIVLLEFKFDFEENYHYEINIMSVYCSNSEFGTFPNNLFNDTYEGQEHFKILAYCPLDVDSGILRYFAKHVKEADNETDN